MKLCDLHTHSTASDGTLSPREVVRRAALHGFSAVALTDHNTTLGPFLGIRPFFFECRRGKAGSRPLLEATGEEARPPRR